MIEPLEDATIIAPNDSFARNAKSGSRGKHTKPRVEADPNLVMAARRYWMTKSGIPPEEIDEHCNLSEYPGTLDEELEQIAALKVVEELNRRIKWNV